MIINTGSRTDIPAYYGEWVYNRIREGGVMVRNPYYPDHPLQAVAGCGGLNCVLYQEPGADA